MREGGERSEKKRKNPLIPPGAILVAGMSHRKKRGRFIPRIDIAFAAKHAVSAPKINKYGETKRMTKVPIFFSF